MAERRHRASYGIDYTPQVIDLGVVKVSIESANVVQDMEVLSQHLTDDSRPMRIIADRMVAMVRENILTGEFTPLLPTTIERRKYPFTPARMYGSRENTGGSQPLVAGRSLVDGIEPRSKKSGGYAAAQRGRDEWYGFLHDRGIGRLDRRTFMELKAGQADELVGIYEDWLMERLDA